MTPERYARLRALFEKILESPRPQREALARELSDGDSDLEADLLALLHSADKSTDPLKTPEARFDAGNYRPAFSPNEILLDRFRIMRFLGRGGMGEVYQADDKETGRVALKTIRPEIAEHPHILARFRHEVQFARKATGTNVCRIHEIFSLPVSPTRPATAFLTMEFLEGVTLSERIDAAGPLPVEEAERIAVQICRGLQTIHDAEVIHRDLKSRNIMLAERKRGVEAVVMDFGLARQAPASFAAAAGASGASVPGAVVGTPQYMAPEQFQGAQLTPATDIYALGVVLYELVTGKLPFAGPTPLAAAVERAKPISKVSTVRQGLPSQWDIVIERCLRYQPEERFQTAAEVAEALTARPSRPRSPQEYLRSNRWLTVAAPLVLAILIAAGFLWYHRPPPPPPPVEAQNWYTRGTAALHEGTYLKAATALEKAISLDKDYVLAHVRLADAWNELDFSDKAKDEMLRASDLASAGALASLDKDYVAAVNHTLVRDFAAAIQDYRRILNSLPGERKADGYVDLGRAYEKASKIDEAIANYSTAAKLDTQSPAAFVRLGVLHCRLKHNSEGESAFKIAEGLYQAGSNLEGIAEIQFQRGANANTQRRLDEARTDLEKSLESAKAIKSLQLEIRALTRLSVTEYLAGNTAKSIELANQAIDSAQQSGLDYWAGEGLVRLGNAYLVGGKYDQAGTYLERALALAQHSQRPRLIALAQQSLASARVYQGRPADALPLAKSAYEFYRSAGFRTESAESLTVLVQAQRDSDDLQAAQRSGEQLLALAGKLNEPVTSMHAEEAVGSVLLILERYPQALDHFQKALTFSHQAKQPELGYLLECADASWRLGDYEEAKRFLAALPPVSRANSGTSYVDEIMSAMLLSRKRYAEAKGIAVRALADPKCQDPGFFYRLSAQIEAASGSPAKAQERATKALTQAKSESDNYALAASNLALANAYLAGGAAAKGLPFAQSAHDYFAASGRRESEYLSLLSLAKICRLTNDTASSKTFAQKGLDIFSEFNHNWVPQRYESYLKRQDVHGVLAELELIRRQ